MDSLSALGLSKSPPKKFKRKYVRDTNRNYKHNWSKYRKCLYDFNWTILKFSFVGTWNEEEEVDYNLDVLDMYLVDVNVSKLYRVVNLLELVQKIKLPKAIKGKLYEYYEEVYKQFRALDNEGKTFEVSEDYLIIDNYLELQARDKHKIIDRLRNIGDVQELNIVLEELRSKLNDY